MTDFLHQRRNLSQGDTVILDCDTQCNFMLLDDNNFYHYRNGRGFEYFGGSFEYFPASITVPRTTYWNVVVDLGGYSGTIRHSIRHISN
ncbi:DUF1883 domain-containing protein [Ferruginibacter sp. HRS2-29]|uniref:DUF1883 domain-containing protein n=1 Tax=Ferruginibacter sp. HRS2-29 TaxID=2487334 RepID=UPI0034E97D04|nr:DUF1883 domain-containing protein [Ferruginibacter sp. HRS2-29]